TGFLQKSFQVSVGAAYTVGSGFIINGRVDTRFAGTYDNQNHTALIKLPFEFNCHLWPTYALGSTALVGVDLGLECLGKKTQGDTELLSGGVRAGGGVWVEGRWGSCTIRAAALYRAPDEFNGYQEDMVFTIPISFSFTF
ncbi:MAG: hypothetical protein FWF29_10735, partial [Treponema sp.]|nr:hypothetical protein [Treponema sp.]